MTAIERLLTFFVAPSAAATRARPAVEVHPAAAAAAPTAIAVLCATRDAAFAGSAVGLWLAREHRARAVLVCRWTGREPEPAAGGGGTPTARRLAERLVVRELAASAAGRLACVALPADAGDARVAAGRAAASAGDVPAVLVLAAARPAAFDEQLGLHDRVLVLPPAGAAEGLTDLAVLDAARVARATGVLGAPVSAQARALVAGGLVLPPSVRAAVGAAVRGHGA